MKVTIRRDCDPFKKYWWVILLGFAAVGGWICLPLMDSSTGGGSVRGGEASLKSEQSLDAAANPSGAPGGAVDLSMGGVGHYKKNDGPVTSSLYQAPEPAASAAPVSMAKADVKLADQLKAVARKSASTDPSGWGGEKAQKGFSAPRAAFGAMGGLPGGSGSGASAASAGGGSSFFGGQNANVGSAATQGLKGGVSEDKVPGAGLKALKNAAASGAAAAKSGSFDASSALSGSAFDGRGGSGAIGGLPGDGGAAGLMYGKMDAAPANLKVDDPFADKKIDDSNIPHVEMPNKDKDAQMRQMVGALLMSVVLGGVLGAVGGSSMASIGMMAGMMMMQQNQQDTTNIQHGAGVGRH